MCVMSLEFTMHITMRIFAYFFIFFLANKYVQCCNVSVCVNIVKKCLTKELCSCPPNKILCNLKCIQCLGKYFKQCCDCVRTCDIRRTGFKKNPVNSYAELLDNPSPRLFQELTEKSYQKLLINNQNCRSETFEVKVVTDPCTRGSPKTLKIEMPTAKTNLLKENNTFLLKCTVLYKSDCTSLNACKHFCRSVGSSGYRWFHNSCCHCTGENCFNFGPSESKCKNCLNPNGIVQNEKDDQYSEECYSDKVSSGNYKYYINLLK
ncbi:hypothetical protein WA026_020746 [Henosepilachna vigintioctopunctata]|uniref:Protein twisted gastrulation n=1 Tax=Henosepilachna vigintioctopunctata TaxID=420089 RepID=A0AAW1U557_9CUCU